MTERQRRMIEGMEDKSEQERHMDADQYLAGLMATSHRKGVPFPEGEYHERVRKVRKEMEEEGLDALLVTYPCNLYYVSGYYTFGVGNHACLVLPLDGDAALQMTSMEIAAGVVNSWVKKFVVAEWRGQEGAGEQLADLAREMGLEKGRLGIEPSRPGLMPPVLQSLKSSLPLASLVDASDLVGRVRLVKSLLEIDFLRKAADYTRAGINASLAAIRPGMLDNDVARVGYDAMIAAGSEFMSVQPIVSSGIRTSYGHTTYRRIPLEVGDKVFLEYGGAHQRYTAPMMRTAVIGEPSDDVLRVADAVGDTVSTIIQEAKPGCTGHDVAMAAKKVYSRVQDLAHFGGTYGYNVGIGFPPTWSEALTWFAEGVEQEMLPGMTFHMPITYRVPGRFGVGMSETIAITEDGCETLTEQERDLYVVRV